VANEAYKKFMAELKAATEEMRVGDAKDVKNIHDLVGAMGQSYTTTVFALQQTTTIKSSISFAQSMIEKHKNADWTKIVTEATLRSQLNTLRTRYKMARTADLIEAAAGFVAGLDDATTIDLLRWVNQYLTFLMRRIRSMLPFYELSIAFEGHRFMVEKAVAPGTTGH
jgi:beta-glucosidase/6-phospho-beta-glucosidase/beta-galactosidase